MNPAAFSFPKNCTRRWRTLATSIVLVAGFLGQSSFAQSATATAAAPTAGIKITSAPITEVSVGSQYTYQLAATAAEPQIQLQYTLRKGPKGMTIGKDGSVKWTPVDADLGDHFIEITAGASADKLATQSFFLTVTSPWTEKSPIRVIHYNESAEGKRVFRVGLLMINTMPTPVVDNPKTPRLEFYTPEKLGHLFFNHQHGANSFIREASYGRVALSGTVVGWLNAPKTGVKSADIINDTNFYFGLAKDVMDFSKYDVFVVHAITDGDSQQTGWLYPAQTVKTPQGTIKNIGVEWMINSAVFESAPLKTSNWSSGEAVLPTTSWAHEFLHTFGINGHANSLNCGDTAIATKLPQNPINGYGGVFSIMGEHAFATHPDVLMKSRLGWIDKAQFPEISKSGSYDIFPLETKDPNVKGVMIRIAPQILGNSGEPMFDGIFLEYREPIGFDRYLERLDGSPFLETYMPGGKVDRHGVIVYLMYTSDKTDGTALVDVNPGTPFNIKRGIKMNGNAGKFADAILAVNKTFRYGNISITPSGLTNKGAMRVKIEIASKP